MQSLVQSLAKYNRHVHVDGDGDGVGVGVGVGLMVSVFGWSEYHP
jgi:hypothetical protein